MRRRPMTLRAAWFGASCAVLLCCRGQSAGPPQARPLADSCDGLTPAALPTSLVAKLPQNGCLGGTSDDGAGNVMLGYNVESIHTFPSWLFFTATDGQARRVGETVLGGDNSSTS